MAQQKPTIPNDLSPILGYGLAVGSVALAVGLALLLEHYNFRGVEFPLFLFTIAVSVWYAGMWPGVLALVLSSLAFNYFFTEPLFTFYVSRLDLPYYAVFILFASLLAWFSTIRRRVEQELRQSRDELEKEVAERTQQASLLNLTHDTIFVRDMSDIITYWNRGAEALYGWSPQEAVGKDSQQLLHAEFPIPLDDVRAELLRTGRWEGELRKTKADGSMVVVASRWDETAAKKAEETLFHVGLEARVSERMRIAREMHDTLLQSLQGLMLRFQAVRNMLPRRPEDAIRALDGALTRADQALTESRDAIQGLRSAPVAAIDLADLLTAMGQELADGQETNCDSPAFCVKVDGEQQTLAPNLQDEVYRIGREALRNAFQHADACHIYAEILFDDSQLRLCIRDDGKGIAPKVLEEGGRAGHWGLIGVRERAKRMGAQLDIRSEPGAGTEVQLTIPASVAFEPSPAHHGWKPVLQED